MTEKHRIIGNRASISTNGSNSGGARQDRRFYTARPMAGRFTGSGNKAFARADRRMGDVKQHGYMNSRRLSLSPGTPIRRFSRSRF